MEHEHNILAELHFTIDPITREIICDSPKEEVEKQKLMQYDHNSKKYVFSIPKIVGNHDMEKANVIQIHYFNYDGSTKKCNEGVYQIEKLKKNENDDSLLDLEWLLTINSTRNSGPLHFLIRFQCFEEDELIYQWHTDFYKDITVSQGADNGVGVIEKYADILEQWEQRLFKSFNNYYTKEENDSKFATKEDLENVGGASSWNDLTDKPFYEEEAITNSIEYDGSVTDIEVRNDEYGMLFYRVADITDDFTKETLIGGTITAPDVYGDGSIVTMEIITDLVMSEEGVPVVTVGEFAIILLEDNFTFEAVGVTFPKKGVYFAYAQGVYCHNLTATSDVFISSTVKKLDSKYIPNEYTTEEEVRAIVDEIINEALNSEV